jgi:hypothetical protein
MIPGAPLVPPSLSHSLTLFCTCLQYDDKYGYDKYSSYDKYGKYDDKYGYDKYGKVRRENVSSGAREMQGVTWDSGPRCLIFSGCERSQFAWD